MYVRIYVCVWVCVWKITCLPKRAHICRNQYGAHDNGSERLPQSLHLHFYHRVELMTYCGARGFATATFAMKADFFHLITIFATFSLLFVQYSLRKPTCANLCRYIYMCVYVCSCVELCPQWVYFANLNWNIELQKWRDNIWEIFHLMD